MRYPIILSGIITGGVVYGSISVLADYFAPILAVIAGFIGGFGLAILNNNKINPENEEITATMLISYCLCGIAALIIGYYIIYNFAEIPISGQGHAQIIIHPNNPLMYPSFLDFVTGTLDIPTIISVIIGSVLCAACVPDSNLMTRAKSVFTRNSR